jgi:hypothetical protein
MNLGGPPAAGLAAGLRAVFLTPPCHRQGCVKVPEVQNHKGLAFWTGNFAAGLVAFLHGGRGELSFSCSRPAGHTSGAFRGTGALARVDECPSLPGFRPIVGESLWYVATLQEHWVALLGWGAAALKCSARDKWIGWPPSLRLRRLHLIANNVRFLILPAALGPIWFLAFWPSTLGVSARTGNSITGIPSCWPKRSWMPPASGEPATARRAGKSSAPRRVSPNGEGVTWRTVRPSWC